MTIRTEKSNANCFRAKFDSVCGECGKGIKEGDLVSFHVGRKTIHFECSPNYVASREPAPTEPEPEFIPVIQPYNPQDRRKFRVKCPCGKERPIIAKLHGDPYCSNVCARKAYGNPLEDANLGGRKIKYA